MQGSSLIRKTTTNQEKRDFQNMTELRGKGFSKKNNVDLMSFTVLTKVLLSINKVLKHPNESVHHFNES